MKDKIADHCIGCSEFRQLHPYMVTFRQADGSYVMKSPFADDNTALQTINTANLWAMQVRAS